MNLMRKQGLLSQLLAGALVILGMVSSSVAQPAAKTWSKGNILTTNAAAEISFALEPASVAPGGTAKLSITFATQDPWYLYERSPDGERKSENGLPVLVHLDKLAFGDVKGPTASIQAEEKVYSDGKTANVYKKSVTFVYEIAIPADQAEGELDLAGGIGAQSCNAKDENCMPPQGFDFRAKLNVAKTPTKTAGEVEWIKSSYPSLKKRIQVSPKPEVPAKSASQNSENPLPTVSNDASSTDNASGPAAGMQNTLEIVGGEVSSLAVALGLALLGGLILNLMPCVLPVIGLKVLSFVEQAGKDRRQIFMLNLVYSLGIISVFLILAGLAAAFGFGWGEQSQKPAFNISMMAIIFAMALSFLGIWEIPIPGFATTPGISHSTQKAGYEGAFVKGIITTLLATPCSGPLLGTVFALTAKLPAIEIFLIYFTVGLGMASPYLIIGAFPGAVKFLPKAGAWMDTFKNLMGFVLLGTVVYLFTLIRSQFYIPTLILLFSIWFALWMVGRVPIYETTKNRLKPWLIGGPIAALFSVWGFWFYLYYENPNELNWQPYSPAALSKATSQGKTVLLDLTAEWCPTCKTNLFFSINQFEVKQLVNQYDVVAMKADLTEESPETDHLLKVQLQSITIPILAVYPANSPNTPIVLRDVVQMQDVLDALKKAGPSKPTSATVVPTAVNKES